jgi:hypothetical protein
LLVLLAKNNNRRRTFKTFIEINFDWKRLKGFVKKLVRF